MYPNLFRSRYTSLQGKDWIRRVSNEDRRAFARIGLEASDYGRSGGNAVVKKHGKKHMKQIARRGAIMTNIRKWWSQQVQLETLRLEEGVYHE
jgi:hypothetical protein